ncbi:MAG: hypothetical protein COB85_08455 [Bacteroidetes bacterium]|nr:MAG: hypothetical protein COB85_08455 [Bacteroidota bacterium]
MPINLGSTINTIYDDDAPFIHPDNVTLYFSSEGHSTMGGYDIYKSELYDNGTWGKPKNLGYPINTTDDDLFFVLSADGRTGYYASGTLGGFGGQDLYTVNMPYEFRHYTIVRGVITSADSIGITLTAKITLKEYDNDEIKAIYNTTSRTGKYLLVLPPNKKFNMSIEAEGYETLHKIIGYDVGDFSQHYDPIKLERKQD